MIVDLIWHFQRRFSAFHPPPWPETHVEVLVHAAIWENARFVSCFFTSLWRLAESHQNFLTLNFRQGESMGKEDRASLPLMPSCPGEDRDDTSSDQGIAGSHKKTYPERARLTFLH